jgi:hypothetical protein
MNNRAIVYIICVVGLVAAGIFSGVVQPVFENDKTYITYFISTITVFVSFMPSIRDWLCDNAIILFLGLLGTILGFSLAISGISDDDIVTKIDGVSTALNTTIVGIVGHLYLISLKKLS